MHVRGKFTLSKEILGRGREETGKRRGGDSPKNSPEYGSKKARRGRRGNFWIKGKKKNRGPIVSLLPRRFLILERGRKRKIPKEKIFYGGGGGKMRKGGGQFGEVWKKKEESFFVKGGERERVGRGEEFARGGGKKKRVHQISAKHRSQGKKGHKGL